MLALARHLGTDLSSYEHLEHPVQQKILEVMARFAGLNPNQISIGIDGCAAPNFAMPIRNMALAYARLVVTERQGEPEELRPAAMRVVHAMLEHPEMIAGTHGRLDTDLMIAGRSRLISKAGAEGVHTVGVLPSAQFPAGLGIAVKIEDGDHRRVINMVVLEALGQLSVLDGSQLASLKHHSPREIPNHRGDSIGQIRPAFQLDFCG